MGVYKLNAQELADIINAALDDAEGDYDMDELNKAFKLVIEECLRCGMTMPPAQEEKRQKRYLHDSKFRDLVSYLRKGIYEEICTLQDIRDAIEIIASLPEKPA